MSDLAAGPASTAGHEAEGEWWRRARCAGSAELFYPPADTEREEPGRVRVRAAISLCMSCPIRARCLDYALRHDIRSGIWGGRTELERAELRIAGYGKDDRAGGPA